MGKCSHNIYCAKCGSNYPNFWFQGNSCTPRQFLLVPLVWWSFYCWRIFCFKEINQTSGTFSNWFIPYKVERGMKSVQCGTNKNCLGVHKFPWSKKCSHNKRITKLVVLFLIGSFLIRYKEKWDLSNMGQATAIPN